MAKKWAAFPHPDKAFARDAAGLKKSWPRLHKSDCEPLPKDAAVLDAWRHYHAGAFADAVAAGRKAGGAGMNAAVKAQMIYANYLEKSEPAKLALLQEAAGWADERRGDAPKDANAHYLYAYSLGRYSQGISITKALAQGFGGKIKDALTTALKLEAKHADAHQRRFVWRKPLEPVRLSILFEARRLIFRRHLAQIFFVPRQQHALVYELVLFFTLADKYRSQHRMTLDHRLPRLL